jgi:hypothetical protein
MTISVNAHAVHVFDLTLSFTCTVYVQFRLMLALLPLLRVKKTSEQLLKLHIDGKTETKSLLHTVRQDAAI